jgi:DNA repair protein RadC
MNEIKVTYNRNYEQESIKISSSRDIDKYIREVYDNIDYVEKIYIIMINRANIVIGHKLISQGTSYATVVDMKAIFQIALLTHADSIILVHNHPSGNLNPSEADNTMTKKVIKAGEIMDIKLLDHIIITSEDYFSFADNNIM